ncbi:ABC transporter permease subunit [Bacillus sp. FSL W7-1360]
MIDLMKNEWIKAWYGRKVWVFLIVLAACTILGTVVGVMMKNYADAYIDLLFFETVFPIFAGFVSLYAVILVSGALAKEFSSGTIKQLFIRPVSRTRILLSKWISIMLLSFLLLLGAGFILFLVEMLFFTENTTWMIGFKTMWSMVLHHTPTLLFYIALATLIGVWMRSTALTIVVAFIPMFFKGILMLLLMQYDWSKWIVFMHFELYNSYEKPVDLIFSSELFDSVWHSAAYIGAHILILLLISHLIFKKRDVL